MDDILTQIQRGNFPSIGASQTEVLCSVARQLAFRLDKLIDVIERGELEEEEEELLAPVSGPGVAYTPIGRMVELMRLELANLALPSAR